MTKDELKQEFDRYFEQKNNEGYLWVSQEMEQIELKDCCEMVCLDFAEPREKRIAELEQENERIKTKYYELQDILKKVRLALIKERTANIMNYGKGGVEMFDDCLEIFKGVSN